MIWFSLDITAPEENQMWKVGIGPFPYFWIMVKTKLTAQLIRLDYIIIRLSRSDGSIEKL
jgi:hypothetical protein